MAIAKQFAAFHFDQIKMGKKSTRTLEKRKNYIYSLQTAHEQH